MAAPRSQKAKLAAALKEHRQALEQQAATAEILHAMSRSPGDPRPVFEAVVDKAHRLCGAAYTVLYRYEGGILGIVGSRHIDARAMKVLRSNYPQPPDPKKMIGKAVLGGKVLHTADITKDPRFPESTKALRRRSVLAVPLLRKGSVVGAISCGRVEARAFSREEIRLLKTFAEQAVIAIENARLFDETKEALERQTASGDILKVISSSPTDLAPVFETIVQSCQRLLGGHSAALLRLVDGDLHLAAFTPVSPAADEELKRFYPRPLEGNSVVAMVARERTPFFSSDIQNDPRASAAARELARSRGYGSNLIVPMLRQGETVGVIVVSRVAQGPFLDKEIALLRTFADQAVIAIENVRLFNETKEALERQTATSDVLRAISRTTFDLDAVLRVLIETATRLAGATQGFIFRMDDKAARLAHAYNAPPAYRELVQSRAFPPSRETLVGRVLLERRPVTIEDVLADRDFHFPEAQRITGFRSMLGVPMLRAGELAGVIAMWSTEVRSFSEQQIALVSTFADQAVIAIENVRLFNETKEALEQQTATAEILKVIASSPTDAQPVFKVIVESAVRLCGARFGRVYRYDGSMIHMVASQGLSTPALGQVQRVYPRPAAQDTTVGQAMLGLRARFVHDIQRDQTVPPLSRQMIEALGTRSQVTMPMLSAGGPIGAIVMGWDEPDGFTDKQVALLQTFADQAVIAIENVRLFNETKEALEQQTAISEILRVISSSPSDVQPVLDAVAERAVRICQATDARIFLVTGDKLRYAAGVGNIAHPQLGEEHHLDRGLVMGRAVIDRAPVHIEDLAAVPEEEWPQARATQRRFGHRTTLAVPLMRESQPVGVILLRRMEVRSFTDRQVALLKTFADQAAIAIENVRLFNETKEALEQQTATSEILRIISGSRDDLGAVFAAILANATSLCEAAYGVLWLRDGGAFTMAALHGALPADQWRTGMVVRPSPEVPLARVVETRKSVHIVDMRNDHGYVSRAPLPVAAVEVAGMRTLLLVPMLKDSEVIGEVAIYRTEVRAFTERQIGLIENFADQAVIAIENVRLFREIQEKSAQLEIANKHKSEFLANMSHELRTPLNAIIGFSEVLSERLFGEVNEKQAEYLKDIHESGRHLLSLINDILDLSKIEAGRMELEVSSFDLPGALSNAITLIRERAQRHSIALGLEVDGSLGEFRGDERKFKQIMLNLLSNAVKFTPDGGKVDVSAKRANGAIEVAVRDTGIGIAAEDQAVVFEEFRQVGRDRMRTAEGTGLGLALTRRFVELHGGEIRLDSTPGQGSTFSFTLPLRP